VSRLRILVRERRGESPAGSAVELTVDVPGDPIKDEPGTVVFRWPPTGESRLMLKVYRRWNIVHWMRKRLTGFRVRREFRALVLLREAGVECVDPVFWGIGWAPDQGRFEVLATREVAAAGRLSEAVAAQPREVRREVLGRLFESVARMHRAGVYHGAPFLGNVLASATNGAPPPLCILDLEKSVCFGRDIRGTRMAEFDLVNLVRSIRTRVGRADARAALQHYGLDEIGVDGIGAAADAYRSSKFQRSRRHVEFLVRGWLTRRRGGASRPPHDESDLVGREYCP